MNKEPTLENIWETRRRIYAECDNDPVKLVQYYIDLQQKNAPSEKRNQESPDIGKQKREN